MSELIKNENNKVRRCTSQESAEKKECDHLSAPTFTIHRFSGIDSQEMISCNILILEGLCLDSPSKFLLASFLISMRLALAFRPSYNDWTVRDFPGPHSHVTSILG